MATTYPILQAPEERLVYTVTEAGEMLGIPRAFADELVARGSLQDGGRSGEYYIATVAQGPAWTRFFEPSRHSPSRPEGA